jgi:hypothetical protein
MSQLTQLKFNIKEFKKELHEFNTLLSTQSELGERSDILPFFKERPFLSIEPCYCKLKKGFVLYIR